MAKAWKELDDGKYAADCVNSMSIALGEGVQPAMPLKYITEYCGTNCWAGPGGGSPVSLDEFISKSYVFDINQVAQDQPDTLGPWQTKSAIFTTDNINVRVKEAIGYVESCCMSGDITVDADADSEAKWCPNKHGYCVNTVDGKCDNPYGLTAPVTTIFESNLNPALTWCGCATEGTPTAGYSGRCARHNANFYAQYEALAKAVCDAA